MRSAGSSPFARQHGIDQYTVVAEPQNDRRMLQKNDSIQGRLILQLRQNPAKKMAQFQKNRAIIAP
ncbi:hypothetical protein ACFS07_32070 [Undibacterium arcticum]